ncbi:MAG: glycosyltransferase involved in cell wall biosynthesis [Verrucomicrobiales bacterium]|jgi:glycosyltransferase involved in cell wall biosynthesis
MIGKLFENQHAANSDQNAAGSKVCLLLEGTYPYVFGGVSAWVDQMMRAMPDRQFELTFIGSRRELRGGAKYALPANLNTVHEIYLHDPASKQFRFTSGVRASARDVIGLTRGYLAGEDDDPMRLLDALCDLASRCRLSDLWELSETWDLLQLVYEERAGTTSFKQFYWNAWNFVAHLWALSGVVDQVPVAPVYHAVCTGYAGMLGAILKRRRGGRFLLSEHGIYVKERLEELRKAEWIADPGERVPGIPNHPGVLTDLWMQFFLFQARVSYSASDQIVSLFERNADVQVEFGANREKIQIVPNGVEMISDIDRRTVRYQNDRCVVGFLGRIVPIKDIKTLLRSASILLTKCPHAEVLIAGPTDEDPLYHAECLELLQSLGLQHRVKFVGKVAATDFLAQIDVIVLTSLSEGLPFALLEAFALGVPAVATDVGACRELVEGRQDGGGRVSGAAGIVTSVAEPEQTAEALGRLLNDAKLREKCSAVGRQRVNDDYALVDVVAAYQNLYDC